MLAGTLRVDGPELQTKYCTSILALEDHFFVFRQVVLLIVVIILNENVKTHASKYHPNVTLFRNVYRKWSHDNKVRNKTKTIAITNFDGVQDYQSNY